MIKGRNKIVFAVMMVSSLLLSLTAEAEAAAKEKASPPKEADAPKEKASAPAPKEKETPAKEKESPAKEKAGAPKESKADAPAKEKAGTPKESKVDAPAKEKAGAPKESKADAPEAGGGGGDKMECIKFVDKMTHSKEKIVPAAKETCGRSQNPQTCERTVMEMNLKESKDINTKTVIALQTKALQEELSMAMKDSEAKGNKDKSYKMCAGSYKKGVDEMASVTDANNMEDINTRITLVLGVMKHVQACQSQLDKDKVDSPLKEVNDFLLKTGENIVAIATAVSAGAIKLE